MKRLLGRWLISLSVDFERSLPGWIQRIVDNDESLRAYQDQSKQLVSLLHAQADAWTESPGSVRVARSSPRLRGFSRQGGWAIACGLLVALFAFGWQGPWKKDGPVISGRRDVDPRPVIAYLDAGRRVCERATRGSRSITRAMPGRVGLSELEPIRVSDAARARIESAGRSYGRALSLIDRSVEDEAKRVVAATRAVLPEFGGFLRSVSTRLDTVGRGEGSEVSFEGGE